MPPFFLIHVSRYSKARLVVLWMTIFGIFVPLLSASAADIRERTLRKALTHAQPLRNVFDRIAESEVLIFGEYHSLGAGSLGYYRLLNFVDQTSPVDCISLELKRNLQDAVNDVVAGRITYAHFLEQTGIIEQGDRWDEVFAFAKDHQIAVRAVDNDDSAWTAAADTALAKLKEGINILDKLPAKPSIEERNRLMSMAIQGFVEEKKCQRLVDISGAEHVSRPDPKDNLQGQIAQLGLKSSTIFLQPKSIHSYLGEVPTMLHQLGQIWTLPMPSGNFGIVSP